MPRRASASVPSLPLLAGGVLLATAVALTGCTPSGPDPAQSPTASEAPAESPTPTPSDAPSADAPTPIGLACSTLVSAQQMYDVNPNFSLLDEWAPDAGSAAAEALADDGVACRWLHDTSNAPLDVAVAAPGATAFAERQNAAREAGDVAPGLGEAAFFSVSGDTGELTVFDGPYWIVVRSIYIGEPADAELLVDAVLTALP